MNNSRLLENLLPPEERGRRVPQGFVEEFRGMASVRVKREVILEKIISNRSGHRKMFEDAIAGYREACIEALEASLTAAKAGKKFKPSITLPEPQDHTSDYDRAIAMLELSLDEELEISQRDFAQYVLDDWGWRADFIATASNYTSVP